MPHQLAVTVRANVPTERLDDLRDLLTEINKGGPANDVLPFDRLTGVHFARLVVLPEATDLAGEAIPPSLAYMSEVDAPLNRHLDDLVLEAGPGLDRIFGHCADYPPQPVRDADRVRWARKASTPGRQHHGAAHGCAQAVSGWDPPLRRPRPTSEHGLACSCLCCGSRYTPSGVETTADRFPGLSGGRWSPPACYCPRRSQLKGHR